MSDICRAKHTRYQPTDGDKIVCPKCGEDKQFIIEQSADGSMMNCELFHTDDGWECAKCESAYTGSQVINALVRRNNVMTCPTCGGTGHVRKSVL
jgi:ssDNA-binding Zn-finger/Zn-ribbon topoisomerase 1